MSSPASVAPPSRPILADRDCSNLQISPNRSVIFSAASRLRHAEANAMSQDSYVTVLSSPPSHYSNYISSDNSSGNNRNLHNNHVNSIPRRRSFQTGGDRRKEQEGYLMRKAAKAIAEKRKAAAVAAAASADGKTSIGPPKAASESPTASTAQAPLSASATASESLVTTPGSAGLSTTDSPATEKLPRRASVPVIFVTVDSAGVRIRDGLLPDPEPRSQRLGSNARMSRSASRSVSRSTSRYASSSASRSASRGRTPDKENSSAAANNAPLTPSSPFLRRRASKTDFGRRGSASLFGENNGGGMSGAAPRTPGTPAAQGSEIPWDGSMPHRKSSCSLIERNARVENRASRTPVKQDSSECVLQRSMSRSSNIARDDVFSSQ